MKVLLVKCHKKTPFSQIEPVVTEPLELEYLSAVCGGLGLEHRLYDSLFQEETFEQVFTSYQPQLLVLTGYITAVDGIIGRAQWAKASLPTVKVLVGGVHAEVNYQDFFVEAIDIIIHGDGLNTLAKLLNTAFAPQELAPIDGIAFQSQGQWQVNAPIPTKIESMPLPDRTYFDKYKHKTKYMHYSPVAMVKTALSCPYNCSFCYCKLLNMGIYSPRPIEMVVEEISTIDAPYIWIIDDTFLIDRARVLEFIAALEARQLRKKFIAYSRVDFIVNNEDLIGQLAQAGFIELIVGMEAVEDRLLDGFTKDYTAQDNIRGAEILARHGINLTGLFIAALDFTHRDFSNLRKGIRRMGLKSYTTSIFTPLKGTQLYKEYENQLITQDYSKWDFLHLTLEPVHMNRYLFYLQFYFIYVEQFFRSKYIRNFLWQWWKKLLLGGSHG